MGEIADLMLNGDICETCGVELGDGDGYTRHCRGCRPAKVKGTDHLKPPMPRIYCPNCGKRCKSDEGVQQHIRDKGCKPKTTGAPR